MVVTAGPGGVSPTVAGAWVATAGCTPTEVGPGRGRVVAGTGTDGSPVGAGRGTEAAGPGADPD